MKNKTVFHQIGSCNKCGEDSNELSNEIYDEGVMCEADTTCNICGHEDLWAYGYFRSSSEPGGIESKCRTYSYDS